MFVLASLNGQVQGARVNFPATTLQIPARSPTEEGELSASSSGNSCVPLKTDRSDQTNRMRPQTEFESTEIVLEFFF